MTEPPLYQPPPPYGTSYGPYRYPPPPPPTNGLAIASLICAFMFAPLGIVFGHMSLSQIKRTGEEGRGLAIAGLVISAVQIIRVVAIFIAMVINVSTAPAYPVHHMG